jgi:DnaK suppressor protein
MSEKKLTVKQLKDLEKKIVEEKERLIFKDVIVSDEFNMSDEEKSDSVDQANAAVSTADRLRFRNRENFYYKKLEEALRRIKEGSYGECDSCSENIGFRRLLARPTAEMCIHCKEESERHENASIFGSRSKSLGKQLQLAASAS